ncbi:MAG: septal ring lytic transglycosylase RlpA family protein [Gammaproteobacteria bacterium]
MYTFIFRPKYSCCLRLPSKQPGFMILVVCLFIHGCAGTQSTLRRSAQLPRDAAPDFPVDVSKVPDPVPRAEPKSKYGNPPSYVVWGKRYYVMNESKEFVERGLASWYGSEFHGRRTSSGEPYDMFAMTAAHKTLPLPSYLQVRNLENGRTIVVRVNDRGPFHDDRIVDLSYTAAKKLDLIEHGTGFVEIRDITPSEPARGPRAVPASKRAFMVQSAASSNASKLYVQIGAFKNPINANKLLSTIHVPDLPRSRIKAGTLDRETIYRVQVGPIASFGEAQRVIARLSELGVTSTRVVSESAGFIRHAIQ